MKSLYFQLALLMLRVADRISGKAWNLVARFGTVTQVISLLNRRLNDIGYQIVMDPVKASERYGTLDYIAASAANTPKSGRN